MQLSHTLLGEEMGRCLAANSATASVGTASSSTPAISVPAGVSLATVAQHAQQHVAMSASPAWGPGGLPGPAPPPPPVVEKPSLATSSVPSSMLMPPTGGGGGGAGGHAPSPHHMPHHSMVHVVTLHDVGKHLQASKARTSVLTCTNREPGSAVHALN